MLSAQRECNSWEGVRTVVGEVRVHQLGPQLVSHADVQLHQLIRDHFLQKRREGSREEGREVRREKREGGSDNCLEIPILPIYTIPFS